MIERTQAATNSILKIGIGSGKLGTWKVMLQIT
jgi:hypothetical protein